VKDPRKGRGIEVAAVAEIAAPAPIINVTVEPAPVTVVETVEARKKRRGRPAGSKDKQPRKSRKMQAVTVLDDSAN